MEIYHVILVYLISLVFIVILTYMVFKGRKRPMILVFLQAAFEIIGLGLLTFYIANVAPDKMVGPDLGSIILGLAAVIMLAQVVTDKVLGYVMPKWMPAAHLATEVIGMILLVLYI
jgi:hypothetical protein